MKIRIVNKSNNPLPSYETELSAGMDIRAYLQEDLILKPLERKLVPTGLFVELPEGHEAQIRPRSGLALKTGLSILNTPGTVDADYRGEVGIIVINLSNKDIVIKSGDRICQMIINRFEKISWNSTDKLNNTKRGEGGFGHTGKE